MIEVVVISLVIVAGSLMVVQTFIMRSCFKVGQPAQQSHFSSNTLSKL